MVYISNGPQLLRYDVTNNTMLSAMDIGGFLSGMDISPDGNTLAVADRSRSDTEVWIHLIDLDSNTWQTVSFARAFYEGGTWTVAYTSDSQLLITSRFEGSGWVPLRRYDPVSAITTELATVRQDTMLVSSGDRNSVAFVESNQSNGPMGLYDVQTQSINTDPGTGWFNYEAGINHNASHISVPTYGGTFYYDGSWLNLGVIGVYAGPQPIGVVYHPAEDIVYYAWRDSSELRAYEAVNMTQVAAYDVGFTFSNPGNHAFQQGRLKTSGDGSVLMATVGGGVQFINLYDALSADSQALSTDEGVSLPITLSASVGNGDNPSYSIVQAPSHGLLSGSGANRVYTPNIDYNGMDQFTFRAAYGKAFVDALVQIEVLPGNSNPVALDDVAQLNRNRLVIPVLQNDYDADGDALTIVSISQPQVGSAAIVNNGSEIYYRARRGQFPGDSFTYTISDGNGGTATAVVSIQAP